MRFGISKYRAKALCIMLGLIINLSTASCAQSQAAKFAESQQLQEKSNTLRLQGDLDGALTEQLKAVAITPDDEQLLIVLASVYSEISREHNKPEYLQKAKETLEKAVKLYPNNAVAHDSLAAALLQLKDKQYSLKERQEAIRLDPTNLRYLTNVGVTQENLGDNESARKTYNLVLLKNVFYIYALYRSGELDNDEGNYETAVETFERALTAKPTELDDTDFQETIKRRLAEIKEQHKNANPQKQTR